MQRRTFLLAILLAAAIAWPREAVRADIAPPKTPPGSTLLPEDAGTAVRMVAETVTLEVSADPQNDSRTIARTNAVFTMRNLGHVDETMAARFPLSFPDGSSDGSFEFPEIPSISVKIDGLSVPTRREMQPPIEGGGYHERDEIPWAVFDVTFPRSRDVVVEVTYRVTGYGYYPQTIFEYVLETGAGWNDTIGEADIIVQLPYAVTDANVFVEESNSSSASTPESVLSANQVRWHFEDLEPTSQDNIEVILVAPALWDSVLKETRLVEVNPKDGEAWGRLAKAYKEAARLPKGWLRDDPAGGELVDLSRDAYETCLALLPKDALWHYGYADLLWSEYYWGTRVSPRGDTQGLLPRLLAELQTVLALDPDNSLAQDLLLEISLAVDGAVELNGDDYVFLALTATPPPPTPYGNPPTEANATATAEVVTTPTTRTAAPEPYAENPVCGSGALSLLLPAAALVLIRRRRTP
jgi:hypothetical protein